MVTQIAYHCRKPLPLTSFKIWHRNNTNVDYMGQYIMCLINALIIMIKSKLVISL